MSRRYWIHAYPMGHGMPLLPHRVYTKDPRNAASVQPEPFKGLGVLHPHLLSDTTAPASHVLVGFLFGDLALVLLESGNGSLDVTGHVHVLVGVVVTGYIETTEENVKFDDEGVPLNVASVKVVARKPA